MPESAIFPDQGPAQVVNPPHHYGLAGPCVSEPPLRSGPLNGGPASGGDISEHITF